jgi:hypothetical protein
LKVQVTQEHINAGEKHDCQLCPLALALGEVFGTNISVTGYEFRFVRLGDGPPKYFLLPKPCSRFMSLFDLGESVSPFEFDLDLIPVERY